jgi:hypothetical protein
MKVMDITKKEMRKRASKIFCMGTGEQIQNKALTTDGDMENHQHRDDINRQKKTGSRYYQVAQKETIK